MGFWEVVRRCVQESDIVIEVLDARLAQLCRNEKLEMMALSKEKPLFLVCNKSDLISKEYKERLRKELGHENLFFVSARKNEDVGNLRVALHITGKRLGVEQPKIAVVGYPNVGKSSVINVLVRRARTVVARKAGTTRGIQWVTFGDMKILDSPGVIPFDEHNEARIALLSAKDPQKLKDPEHAAQVILDLFIKNNSKSLRDKYGVDIESTDNALELIGRSRHFLKKGGVIDERRAALTVLNDWQKGTLKLFND